MATTTFTVTVLVEDALGKIVTADGIVYRLTACCEASATGTEYGTACRACYQPIAEIYGDAELAGDNALAAARKISARA